LKVPLYVPAASLPFPNRDDAQEHPQELSPRQIPPLLLEQLQDEVKRLGKQVDEKFPPSGLAVRDDGDGAPSVDTQRRAKARELAYNPPPLFQKEVVNSNG